MAIAPSQLWRYYQAKLMEAAERGDEAEVAKWRIAVAAGKALAAAYGKPAPSDHFGIDHDHVVKEDKR